jgi:hypothetical protein
LAILKVASASRRDGHGRTLRRGDQIRRALSSSLGPFELNCIEPSLSFFFGSRCELDYSHVAAFGGMVLNGKACPKARRSHLRQMRRAAWFHDQYSCPLNRSNFSYVRMRPRRSKLAICEDRHDVASPTSVDGLRTARSRHRGLQAGDGFRCSGSVRRGWLGLARCSSQFVKWMLMTGPVRVMPPEVMARVDGGAMM